QPPPGEPAFEEPADADADGGDSAEAPADEPLSRAPTDELYIYPNQGQSEEQVDADRAQCHQWAVEQVGYDPDNASTGFQVGQKRVDFDRAFTACLEGRGYTVK